MRKTEYLVRLLHLSVTGMGFCVTTSLLISAAVPVRAGEPAATLALNQPTGENSTASNLYSAPDNNGLFFNLIISQPKAASVNNEMPLVVSPGILDENQSNLDLDESLPLVRNSSHSNQRVTVRAGYGQISDDKSVLEKLSSEHQEPGLAYVSANFSF